MVRKPFILKLFDTANMQRWNDKISPVELRELDKQAHKMIIAYILGKREEDAGTEDFDWIEVIEGGIFELLQRSVITDLKPQLFNKIREDRHTSQKLNDWVFTQLSPLMSSLGKETSERLHRYLEGTGENINRRILHAAHAYATHWEFQIIERANPEGYEIRDIKKQLDKRLERYSTWQGRHLLPLTTDLKDFVDLCGELRFQLRWSHLYIVPRTSVLGHMLIVAILCYFFSRESGACRRRCINNFFTGLFHDLAEVLTRDIIDPVKRGVEGLEDLIKDYEKREMEEKLYKLIPARWHEEMKMFTEEEFADFITENGKRRVTSSQELCQKYNSDEFNPRDGRIVQASDHLAAFTEAYLAMRNGITRHELSRAKHILRARYQNKIICGLPFNEIYADFDA